MRGRLLRSRSNFHIQRRLEAWAIEVRSGCSYSDYAYLTLIYLDPRLSRSARLILRDRQIQVSWVRDKTKIEIGQRFTAARY
jgi:hypothetical protein